MIIRNTILAISLLLSFSNIIDIFYLSGELISLHLLRCGPLVVDDHNFMGRRLSSSAISTRE
jgi:hypothetical protein